MDGVVTAITTGVADLTDAAPAVIGIGVGIAVLFWGAPKLIGLLKRTSK